MLCNCIKEATTYFFSFRKRKKENRTSVGFKSFDAKKEQTSLHSVRSVQWNDVGNYFRKTESQENTVFSDLCLFKYHLFKGTTDEKNM